MTDLPDLAAAGDLDGLVASFAGLLTENVPRVPGDFGGFVDTLAANAGRCRDQISARWLDGGLDAQGAMAAYTALAQATLDQTLTRCIWALAGGHGRFLPGRFCVLAFGKMGSAEMSAQSDMDVVFVYDVPEAVEESDGIDMLPAATYFARLARQLIGALTAYRGTGMLYEVDARLRPFGDSGPIATSIAAFRRYYRTDAWTWEFQALTRARPVAGDADLGRRLDAEVKAILAAPRDQAKLVKDVADMRGRMAQQFADPKPWSVKHRRGGLVDIEFLAQYGQLRHGPAAPEILCPGTMEALERLGRSGCYPATVARDLKEALGFWQTLQLAFRAVATREPCLPEEAVYDRALAVASGLDDAAARARLADSLADRVVGHFRRLIDEPAAGAAIPA
jgi:glutamate-ammonia-ligase adenylyltransferase